MESARDVLECTICLEISASPIHTCTNGHVVCGICVDKIVTCALCKSDLGVNQGFERIARRNDFVLQCPNSIQGCTKSVKSFDMKDHLNNSCGYRPIACVLKGLNSCQENALQVKEYFPHLTTVHRLYFPYCNNETTGEIQYWGTYHNFENQEGFVGKVFDGNQFILFRDFENGIVSDWAAVIGDQQVADQYKFIVRNPKIPSDSTVPASKYPEFFWKLPIVPVHESALSKCEERGNVARCGLTTLALFSEESYENEGGQMALKYRWNNIMEIVKV